jgi:histidinol-phosphate phosphatase family protein
LEISGREKITRRRILKAVFLDRDGVINEEVDYLHKPSQLRLIPGSAAAIRRLNEAGIRTIVISNQSAVARNICSEDDLKLIHDRLSEMLAADGARLDAVYYCPHHPELKEGEGNPAYCVPCECRKPKIGMLQKACADFGLKIEECVLVGDTTRDIETARRAGCRSVLVRTGYGGSDASYDAKPNLVCDDLADAVSHILDR